MPDERCSHLVHLLNNVHKSGPFHPFLEILRDAHRSAELDTCLDQLVLPLYEAWRKVSCLVVAKDSHGSLDHFEVTARLQCRERGAKELRVVRYRALNAAGVHKVECLTKAPRRVGEIVDFEVQIWWDPGLLVGTEAMEYVGALPSRLNWAQIGSCAIASATWSRAEMFPTLTGDLRLGKLAVECN
jgi:hypothetical protein